ncbi:hypothetical protein H072_9873 [Dactylellina haptotyla CBS 200.50]|uniref:PB1 domain-containing protein n=1 Tax=Dactylellina haptotyla (strain CBS 200.50) TaxID=1284197 RepID=S8BN05_DACHA|nr:hypothetical protein H072_9873 [Dactylellina haptotyla CBS 200.50]
MENINPLTPFGTTFHGLPNNGAFNMMQSSDIFLTKNQAMQLIAETQKAAHATPNPLDVYQKPKRPMLARCITIDPATNEVWGPSAYRVIEFNGDESYSQVIALVTSKLGFHTPGKTLRSIQVHNEQGTTQIVVDSDEAVRYFMGMLQMDKDMRMSVYAIEKGGHDQRIKKSTSDTILTAQFDPSATTLYQRAQRQKSSPHRSTRRQDEESDSRSRSRYRSRRRESSDYSSDDSDSTDYESRRYHHRSRSRGRPTRPRSRSASPRYRDKANSYRQREYNLENDPKELNRLNRGTSNTSRRVRSQTRSENYPQSTASASVVGTTKAETPGRQSSQALSSAKNDDIEDGEIKTSVKDDSKLVQTPQHSSRVAEDARNLRKPMYKIPRYRNNNHSKQLHRRSSSSDPKYNPDDRICSLYLSPAGKNEYVVYKASHLRVRLEFADKLQKVWNPVADEVFERIGEEHPDSRYINREKALVFMLYMRIAPRPRDSSIYDADGDVGVLINSKALEPGSLRYTWMGDQLRLCFRNAPGSRFIKRSTKGDAHKDVGGPRVNGNCHVGVNLDDIPPERMKGNNFRAIRAFADILEAGEKVIDFVIEVGLGQLGKNAPIVLAAPGGFINDPTMSNEIVPVRDLSKS